MREEIIYSKQAVETAAQCMAAIKMKKVRNHKLGNSVSVHSGEQEEGEYMCYRDFLKSKNCDLVNNLRGSDNCD